MTNHVLRYGSRPLVVIATLVMVATSCSAPAPEAISTATPDVSLGQLDAVAVEPVRAPTAESEFISGSGSLSLVTLSPPAAIVEARGLRLVDRQGNLILLEATIDEVAYMDNSRPDVAAPSGTIKMWASLNTLWGPKADVAMFLRLVADPVVLILGFQTDTSIYSDLRNTSPFSLMGVVESGDPAAFVGPGTEQYSQGLAKLSESWQGSTASLLGQLARELRIREVAIEENVVVPALQLVDELWVRPLTPVQAYEALSIGARDVEEAPEEIRSQLVRRSILVEILGGTGLDNVAVGVQTDAGWAGGAISTLGGSSWVALLQPDSKLRLLLYHFGSGENEPVVIAEVPTSLWDSSEGVYFAVPNDLVVAFASGKFVAPDTVSFVLLDATLLRAERSRVDALGNSPVAVDMEPLPSELTGFESTD